MRSADQVPYRISMELFIVKDHSNCRGTNEFWSPLIVVSLQHDIIIQGCGVVECMRCGRGWKKSEVVDKNRRGKDKDWMYTPNGTQMEGVWGSVDNLVGRNSEICSSLCVCAPVNKQSRKEEKFWNDVKQVSNLQPTK